MKGYCKNVEINAPVGAVYEAITEDIVKWWTTGSEGASELDAVFTTRFDTTYNHIKVSHLIRNQRVEWEIMEHFHDNETLNRKDEWTGTRIIWNLTPVGADKTNLDFVHEGLVESMQCWDICETGWNFFLLDSLKPYLETGYGQPYQHQHT